MRNVVFAPATPVGRTALTVVRVSGSGCGELLARLVGRLPAPRMASLRRLRGLEGEVLDRALVLWLPGPGSYTGEDCAELHLHGGFGVWQGVQGALLALGARPADPGEFTRRAVLAGRMDLLEAEAVLDLIEAETISQRDQALRHLDGAMSRHSEAWRRAVLEMLALQEALIDFPEDEVPRAVEAALLSMMQELDVSLAQALADGARAQKLRSGLVFAVVGPPNAGKSSLINALAERDVAIVSPVAGTTRDIIEARIVLAGVPVTLLDTAGLRDSEDPIEQEGVRRARRRMTEADLVIALAPADTTSMEAANDGIGSLPEGVLRVVSKSDLGDVPEGMLAVSTLVPASLDVLRERLAQEALLRAGLTEAPAVTRERHAAAVREGRDCLALAMAAELPELRGEALRRAARAIGRLTGVVSVEEVLDSVFGQFCIGK